MKRSLRLIPVAFPLLISCLYAVENTYVMGTILEVQQKAHTRVLYYVVDTPITRDDPYFEIQIQIKDKIYTGEHATRHAADLPPSEWKPESEVKIRLEKHSMFLQRPDGQELEFVITRHTAAPASSQTPQSAPSHK
jgi:hypothetical protein